MAKKFALRIKQIMENRADAGDLVGEVLSVSPLKVSCHEGEWVLNRSDDDIRLIQSVQTSDLEIGDNVLLSGKEAPFTIVGVI